MRRLAEALWHIHIMNEKPKEPLSPWHARLRQRIAERGIDLEEVERKRRRVVITLLVFSGILFAAAAVLWALGVH